MARYMLPYKSGKVTLTSPFGWRNLNGQQNLHKGIDLCGTTKTLTAPCDGIVGNSTMITDKSNATWEWGNYIRLDTSDGYQIFLCHMAERKVKIGQKVKAGDIIGIEGNTGYSFGSHCHFEIRKNGISIDPTPFLNIANAPGTYDAIPDYAALVCKKCGLEEQTKKYLNAYKYAPDLWRKLWGGMQ